jgi:hypothetical protein
MCFNKEASFLAWTLSYTIAYYLYNRNKNYDRWNAAFILCFTTIQLLEAGVWLSLDDPKSVSLNDLLTRLLLIALMAQPLVQSYMGYKYTQNNLLALMSFVFLGILLWGFVRIARSKPGQFVSYTGPKGHLVWTDGENQKGNAFLGNKLVVGLYLAGLFVPLLIMGNRGMILLAVGVAAALYSTFFANPEEFGSYWCFASVAYAVAAIFV